MSIHPARPGDLGAIQKLYRVSRHAHLDGGIEDLPDLLESEPTAVLRDAHDRIVAFAAARTSPPPHRSRPGAPARAVLASALIDHGISIQSSLVPLFLFLLKRLEAQEANFLISVLTEERWLIAALEAVGFERVDSIRYLRRTRYDVPPVQGPAQLTSLSLDEVETLARVDGAAFDDLWHMDADALRELSVTCRIRVARIAERLVGYAAVSLHPAREPGGDGVAQLVRLAVLPEMGRQGIGGQLLADAIAYARENDIRLLLLNTQESNRASQNLYEKYGFRTYGTRVPVLALRRSQAEPISSSPAIHKTPTPGIT